MNKLIAYIGFTICFFPITALGWDWAGETGPGWMKFHPATYLFAIGALIGLGSLQLRYWRVLFSWAYGPLTLMTFAFIVYGIVLARTSVDPTGAVGIAITNFLTPVLFLITTAVMVPADWKRAGTLLRVLMIVNSVTALTESMTHTSFFFLQGSRIFRSGGLIGHPLPSALLTGCMIVYLLTATNHKTSLLSVLPEAALHTAALFTFGGRTGLVLVPLVVAVSVVLPAPGMSPAQGILRRLVIVFLLLSALLIPQLQIDAVQTALNRFTTDSGSADTRYAALQMISELPTNDLLWGVSPSRREYLMLQYGTTIAFENPWISLILIFGAVLVALMAIALLVALFARTMPLDRSAKMISVYFLVATAGYVSFGSKSLLILQVLLMISALCQTRPITVQADRPNSDVSDVLGRG